MNGSTTSAQEGSGLFCAPGAAAAAGGIATVVAISTTLSSLGAAAGLAAAEGPAIAVIGRIGFAVDTAIGTLLAA